MVYVTTKKAVKEKQLTWDDIIDNLDDKNLFSVDYKATGTYTYLHANTPRELLYNTNIGSMISVLKQNEELIKFFFEKETHELYHSYKIPKHSGGLRQIDEPCEELKAAQTRLAEILSYCGGLYHTSAFAYIKGRSTIDAVKKHQANESNWYLKTDFSNFFGNTNFKFVMKMLSMIFPFNEIMSYTDGRKTLENNIKIAFLNGGLPQGSPCSPFITNLIMIPIDHALFNKFANRRIVYTRYADDMIISCRQSFDYHKIIDEINEVLKEFDAPYTIKDEKTRYGSRKGQNWNLGLMVNKDNNITVGYQKKKQFKAMLNSLFLDTMDEKLWEIEDIYAFKGLLSYYLMIEKDYFTYLIKKCEEKNHITLKQIMKIYNH